MTLPCFVCSRELESAVSGLANPSQNQPYGGTTFYSPGQYGSTAWDPQSPMVKLELNICDPCLVAGAERARRVVRMLKETAIYEEWDPRPYADPDVSL